MHHEAEEVDLPKLLLVGSGLYSVLTAALHPLNVLKTRAQAASSEVKSATRFEMLRILTRGSGGGLGGLFSGLGPVLAGAVPARASYILALEGVRPKAEAAARTFGADGPSAAAAGHGAAGFAAAAAGAGASGAGSVAASGAAEGFAPFGVPGVPFGVPPDLGVAGRAPLGVAGFALDGEPGRFDAGGILGLYERVLCSKENFATCKRESRSFRLRAPGASCVDDPRRRRKN